MEEPIFMVYKMILTTKSKYAVIAIVEVASNRNNLPTTLATISKKQDISLSYLEQIFLKLKKANIVSATKGPGGGYKLSIDPKDITVENIIDVMGENLKMTRCSVDKNCRKNGIHCKTHSVWKGFSLSIRKYFSTISIEDIVEGRLTV